MAGVYHLDKKAQSHLESSPRPQWGHAVPFSFQVAELQEGFYSCLHLCVQMYGHLAVTEPPDHAVTEPFMEEFHRGKHGDTNYYVDCKVEEKLM